MYKKYNFTAIENQKYNLNSRIYHRLDAWWDTTHLDGVKVFKDHMNFWESGSGLRSSKEFLRFIKALGLTTEDLDENKDAGRDYDELKRVYFSLRKRSSLDKELGVSYFVNLLNNLDKELTINISTQDGERYFSQNGTIFDKDRVLEDIQKNTLYQYLWANESVNNGNGSYQPVYVNLPKYGVVRDNLERVPYYDEDGNPETDDYGNILYDEGLYDNRIFAILTPELYTVKEVKYVTAFTTTKVGSRKNEILTEQQISELPEEYSEEMKDILRGNSLQTVNIDANVRIDIRLVLERTRSATNSDIAYVENWFNSARAVFENGQSRYTGGLYITKKPNYYDVMYEMLLKEFPIPDDEVWYRGYLRYDAFYSDGKNLRRSQLSEALMHGLDTGYKVKDAEVWEIIVAVIVIIAAIAATVLSLGAAGPVSAAAVTGSIVALTAVATIGSIALAMYGGRSAYHLTKTVGDVMIVLGVVSLVSGLINYMNAAAQEAAKQTAAAAATGSSTVTTTVDVLIDNAINAVKETFSSVSAFGDALKTTMSTINNVMSTVQGLQNMIVDKHNASATKEYADDIEGNKLIFENEQFEQLTKIDMMYADLYDYSNYFSTNERKSMI